MTYLHLSEKPLEIGLMLKATDRFWFPEEIEKLLDDARPEVELPRGQCVYMLTNQEFKLAGIQYDQGHIYEVVPHAEVSQRDILWIRQLQLTHLSEIRNDPKSKLAFNNLKMPEASGLSKSQLAENYWSENPSPKPFWEHVTEQAEVVRYVGPWSRNPSYNSD